MHRLPANVSGKGGPVDDGSYWPLSEQGMMPAACRRETHAGDLRPESIFPFSDARRLSAGVSRWWPNL